MITNYFIDLWEKAESLGIKKAHIGREMFKDYRQIYQQGNVSKYMQKTTWIFFESYKRNFSP